MAFFTANKKTLGISCVLIKKKNTRMITDPIELGSVLLPLLIVSITKWENLILGIFINVNKSH